MDDDGGIAYFLSADNSTSFKFKQKIKDVTGDDGTKNVETMVPLKYLSNFWRTLEIPLIDCEFNLILTWSRIMLYLMLLRIKQQHLQ